MSEVICTLDSVDTSLATNAREKFAKDVAAGLAAQHKNIPAIYHYDAEGSRLFDRITQFAQFAHGVEIPGLQDITGGLVGQLIQLIVDVLEEFLHQAGQGLRKLRPAGGNQLICPGVGHPSVASAGILVERNNVVARHSTPNL